jgi:hypothetical protein
MNLTTPSNILPPGLKRDWLASSFSKLWIIASLTFFLPLNAAAANSAVVLGSFSQKSNAEEMLENLAKRDDLAKTSFTIASNNLIDKDRTILPLFRVVTYGQDSTKTRALLSDLRDAGFDSAWYLEHAQILKDPTNHPQAASKNPAIRQPQSLEQEAPLDTELYGDQPKKENSQIQGDTPAFVPAAIQTVLVSGIVDPQPLLANLPNNLAHTPIAPVVARDQISTEADDTTEIQAQAGKRDSAAKTLKWLNPFRYMTNFTTLRNALYNDKIKWRVDGIASQNSLPNTALKRSYFDDDTSSYTADLHMEWQQRFDNVILSFDHVFQWNAGDIIPWSKSPYGAQELRPLSDRPRKFDLTSTVADGNRYRLHSHFRELMMRWEGEQWSAGIGRDQMQWGTGIMFHPMGLFNPLPPLHVNGDDQVGQDHITIKRAWNQDVNNSQSLALFHVDRRSAPGLTFSDNVSTTALKWHRKSNRYTFGVTAARHYARALVGLEASHQKDAITISSNLTFRERDPFDAGSAWGLIGVVNARVDLSKEGRSASIFAEYFHDGFGLNTLPDVYIGALTDLDSRLARQETFTLMRNYIALGGDFDWNHSLRQDLKIIVNLHDSSAMVKAELTYLSQDYMRLQLGLITQLSQYGDEFAPLQIGKAPRGDPITWGGGSRVYLRWEFNR